MSSSVSSETVSRSLSIVVNFSGMSGFSPMFSTSSQGGCCLRFQSRRLPLGLGCRVGLRESSESVAVEDYRRCHAVPGLVQQMKGVKDGVFGVSSLSIDFINFMRTCFLLLNLKFYIIPDPWVVFLM